MAGEIAAATVLGLTGGGCGPQHQSHNRQRPESSCTPATGCDACALDAEAPGRVAPRFTGRGTVRTISLLRPLRAESSWITHFVIDLLHRARGVNGVALSKSLEGVLPRRRNITAEQFVMDEGGRLPQVVFELSE